MADPQEQSRSELLEVLLRTIDEDPYPSSTMMDIAEQLLRPDEVPTYVRVLLKKVASERFPSVSMVGRLRALIG